MLRTGPLVCQKFTHMCAHICCLAGNLVVHVPHVAKSNQSRSPAILRVRHFEPSLVPFPLSLVEHLFPRSRWFLSDKECSCRASIVATFRVARLSLQTPRLWLVDVATDRDARHACLRLFTFSFSCVFFCLRFFSFHLSSLFFCQHKKSKKKKKQIKKNQKRRLENMFSKKQKSYKKSCRD